MQAGHCHQQNYKEILEPQKEKDNLLIDFEKNRLQNGSLWDTRSYSLKLTVCVVNRDALPVINQNKYKTELHH